MLPALPLYRFRENYFFQNVAICKNTIPMISGAWMIHETQRSDIYLFRSMPEMLAFKASKQPETVRNNEFLAALLVHSEDVSFLGWETKPKKGNFWRMMEGT